MFKHLRATLPALALLLALPAWAQEIQPSESGSDLFVNLGNFLRQGLSAPRTAADLAREEEKARAAAMAAPAPSEPEPPAPVIVPAALPVDPPAPVMAAPLVTPVIAAPPVPPVIAAPPAPVMAAPLVTPVIAAPPAPVMAAPPAARSAKAPRPIEIPVSPQPEPITASDRIAGTATLDQALKLGGPTELYGRRIRRPAEN